MKKYSGFLTMRKTNITAMLSVCLMLTTLPGCAEKEPSISTYEPSSESSCVSTQTVLTDTDHKEAVFHLAEEHYDTERILSARINGNYAEVKILTDLTADGKAPENWDNLKEQASLFCTELAQKAEEFAFRNAVVYLVDQEDNNLLTVLDGHPTFNAFEKSEMSQDNPGTISLEEFNAISSGMSYDEVFKIVGSRGEVLSESGSELGDAYHTITFSWVGEGTLGANANVMFQGGKVISKAQFGLE